MLTQQVEPKRNIIKRQQTSIKKDAEQTIKKIKKRDQNIVATIEQETQKKQKNRDDKNISDGRQKEIHKLTVNVGRYIVKEA